MAQSSLPAGEALRAVQLGVVAGMRSQMPFALLALAAQRGEFAAGAGRPLSLLRAPAALAGLGFAALGEVVGDKLPRTPSRLAPGPLIARLVIGAAAGAAMAREAERSTGPAAGLGAAGAALGSYAGYHLRASAGRTSGMPDPVWGATEDVLAVALGVTALRCRRKA